jgi:predicted Zn-ribbon and HTH transcriptional regulator
MIEYKKIEKEFSIKLYSNERESQIAAMRLSVCFLCEYRNKENDISICNKCNCYLNSKVINISSKCPINKWLI